jgi:hypothetical protein
LDQTKPIALGNQTHRFRINGDRWSRQKIRQQIIGKILLTNLKICQISHRKKKREERKQKTNLKVSIKIEK